MQQQLPGPQPSLGFWLRALRLVFGVYGAAAFAALLARHALCAGAGQPLVAWPAMTESSHAVVAVCVLLLALLAGLELRAAWAGGEGGSAAPAAKPVMAEGEGGAGTNMGSMAAPAARHVWGADPWAVKLLALSLAGAQLSALACINWALAYALAALLAPLSFVEAGAAAAGSTGAQAHPARAEGRGLKHFVLLMAAGPLAVAVLAGSVTAWAGRGLGWGLGDLFGCVSSLVCDGCSTTYVMCWTAYITTWLLLVRVHLAPARARVMEAE